jgi:hypothetical protein
VSRIFKYTLHDHGEAILPLPSGAEVLHVADQCGAIQLWARVNPNAKPLVGRRFATLYTGFDEVPEGAIYLGTALSQGGSIVTHVFELASEGAKD